MILINSFFEGTYGKKPLKFGEKKETSEEENENYDDDNNDNDGSAAGGETKTIKSSTTDPEIGYMHRDGKLKGFFYLNHRMVHAKCNIITDTFVTPGNINYVKPYIDRLKYQIETFGFDVKTVELNAGFNTSAICKQLYDPGINAAMGQGEVASRKANTNSHISPTGTYTSVRRETIWSM